MATSQSRVAVIMLTYNSVSKLGSFFDEVLQGVLMQDYPSLEVIFVDNASGDGTPDYIKSYIERLGGREYKVLLLKRNRGWSGGNNIGALLAKDAEYLFFMNDDVILEQSCIRTLIDAISNHQNLAAVQPLIMNKDGSLNYGLDLGLSGFPKMIQHQRGDSLCNAFYVSGAALLTRSGAFFDVGMFDDSLFIYHDDADYSWRLRLMGYEVACVTNARAYHWGSATLGSESPQYFYFLTRNNIWIIAKNSSLVWIFPRLFLMLIETLISFFGYMLMKKNTKVALHILRALLEGFMNLHIPFSRRASIAKIKRVKEKEVNRVMSTLIDVDLIFPRTLRRVLGLKW